MAIIHCADCGSEISDAAPACPKCGRPSAARSGPVTIERTGKKWKLAALVGAMLCAGGCISCITGGSIISSSGGNSNSGMVAIIIGVLLGFTGFAVFIVARIGKWWHHD